MIEEEQATFSPAIKKAEDDIIDKLVRSPLFSEQKHITSIIICYFFTRKYLTQQNLKHLTGFSAGMISRVLNKLIKRGTIRIFTKTSTGKIIYSMDSIQASFITIIINSVKSRLRWEDILKKINTELQERKKSLGKQNGYAQIKKVVDFYLSSMPFYKKLLNYWERAKLTL
ncbi:MAG: hypothetical protein HWN80_15615 [Candidatus Lokiarchaeota archaeon]|nr:hypothetical protein [Candidatus Lokiarchaeota archaeon]